MSTNNYFWIIGGGLMQVPLVDIAKELGLKTIVTDLSPNCVCAPLADAFYPVNIFDIPTHIELADKLVAEGLSIKGVLAAGIDAPETMARLSKHLGLPGVDPEIAHLVNHKEKFRQKLVEINQPTPKFIIIDDENNDDLPALIAEIGYPLIVKNTSSSGSRGTKIFFEPDDTGVAETVAIARDVSRSGKALLEKVWTGHEVTVETLYDAEGTFHPCFVTDRFFDKNQGYALETGLRNPAKISPELETELYETAKTVADSLGITIGAAKYDMMLTPEGPRIIEMTVRLSGGFDCQYLVPAASGKEVMKAAMLTAMGQVFDPTILQAKKNHVALSSSIWPEPGKIVRIDGLDEVEKIPGLVKLIWRYTVGDVVEPYIDCTKRVCFILVEGKDEDTANATLDHIKNTLNIVTEPVT